MVGRNTPSEVPAIDAWDGGKKVYGDVRALLSGYEDAFENLVAARTNVLDLAAHYPYTPERWRLFVDGSRVFPEYNSVSQYTHDTDRHLLQPASGETVTFESAERPRYVVQYELATTWAFTLNQSLQSGDSIRIGLYDGSDGWYMEQTGGQADDVADFVLERNGSEVYRESDIDIQHPTTQFGRLRLQTGWYDVTRQSWERSYPSDGAQENPAILEASADDARGSRTGNLPVHYSVTASASTSGLELEAGSAAQVNLGDTTPLKRTKQHSVTATLDATGTWVPLVALRVDPDNDIVSTQLVDAAIAEFAASDDVEVSVHSFDPSNVLDSGGNTLTDSDFSTPAVFDADNNVIETTTAVEQIPDSSGTTGTSATNPGGFQIGYDLLTTASGNTVASNSGTAVVAKRPIYGRDVAVVLAKSGSTGDVTTTLRYEQDW